jgi:hypothetical protein
MFIHCFHEYRDLLLLLVGGGVSLLGVEGLYDWGQMGLASFTYTLSFALQLRKSMKNLSQACQLVLDASHIVDLATFLGPASTDLLNIGPP